MLGRSIDEGIIIVHETINMAKKDRIPSMIIKIDILRAYDLVDRHFLLKVLNKFNFVEKWIEWVGSCILNPKFLVLVNGKVQGFFNSTRGIR